MNSHAAAVAHHLLEIKAVKLRPNEPFTWASGILSPIYCDNRVALSYPKVRNFLRDCLVASVSRFSEFDAVAGVATAGIPLGALLADQLEKPFIYVRSSAKDHGRQNLIEGEIHVGAKVLMVEDLISTGGSCLKAADALLAAGCTVVGVLAVFQYNFPEAEAAFAQKGVPFATLSDYNTLVDEAVRMGYINETELAMLKSWRENPQKWGALYA